MEVTPHESRITDLTRQHGGGAEGEAMFTSGCFTRGVDEARYENEDLYEGSRGGEELKDREHVRIGSRLAGCA